MKLQSDEDAESLQLNHQQPQIPQANAYSFQHRISKYRTAGEDGIREEFCEAEGGRALSQSSDAKFKIMIILAFFIVLAPLVRYWQYTKNNPIEISQNKFSVREQIHNQAIDFTALSEQQANEEEDFQFEIVSKTYKSEEEQNEHNRKNKNSPNVFRNQNPPPVIEPSQSPKPVSPQSDKYTFDQQIERVVQNSGIQYTYHLFLEGKAKKAVASSQELAVLLLDINHWVGFDGQIKVKPTIFEKTDEDLKFKAQRIRDLVKAQRNHYEEKYSIKEFKEHKQLPFCIVVPSYNNVKSRLYLRNLDSILQQNYDNYHVVYIDDKSPDETGKKVKEYLLEVQKRYPQDAENIASKFKVIINQQNQLALANIYLAIHEYCKAGEIAMLLDGDDSFIGTQVLSVFNAFYQQKKAALVYSKYLHITGNAKVSDGGSSKPIPNDALTTGTFRSLQSFYTSHLLTFYVDLFRLIAKEDLQYDNVTFFKYAYDVALVTPMIQMAGTGVHMLPQFAYQYRFDTGMNDPSNGQLEVDDIVFAKKPYAKLQSLPFIFQAEPSQNT